MSPTVFSSALITGMREDLKAGWITSVRPGQLVAHNVISSKDLKVLFEDDHTLILYLHGGFHSESDVTHIGSVRLLEASSRAEVSGELFVIEVVRVLLEGKMQLRSIMSSHFWVTPSMVKALAAGLTSLIK